jgi:AraC family transcriptional regulator
MLAEVRGDCAQDGARAIGWKPSLPDPVGEIELIVGAPPPLAGVVLGCGARLTPRWAHGAVHDYLPPLSGHLLATYYSAAQDISWRRGAVRLASRTRPGSVTVIPEGRGGHWDVGGPVEVSHVYLTDRRLQACAAAITEGRRVELTDRVAFDDPAAGRIMQLLGQEALIAEAASRMFVEQVVDLLCTQLVRGHSSDAVLPSAPRRGLADWQVKKVTAHMRDHLDGEINLETVARLVGLSRYHFCTAFRLATGQTPHAWLTELRMARARRLLAEPGLSITEIALAVGYQTPSAFAATFRKAVGVTPSEFRRAL